MLKIIEFSAKFRIQANSGVRAGSLRRSADPQFHRRGESVANVGPGLAR
jgi:hypothetical protein